MLLLCCRSGCKCVASLNRPDPTSGQSGTDEKACKAPGSPASPASRLLGSPTSTYLSLLLQARAGQISHRTRNLLPECNLIWSLAQFILLSGNPWDLRPNFHLLRRRYPRKRKDYCSMMQPVPEGMQTLQCLRLSGGLRKARRCERRRKTAAIWVRRRSPQAATMTEAERDNRRCFVLRSA